MREAFVIIRVSSQDQLKGYGPNVQWFDDVIPNAPLLGLEVSEKYRRVIQESATTWERAKFEGLMREALTLYQKNEIEALLFPRVDRETRFIFGSFPLLCEVVRSGLKVFFARERFELDPNNPESTERYLNKATQAQAYVETLRLNTMRGRRARVASGKIPGNRGKHFGFYYVPGKGEGEGIRHINEDEAQWIRKWKDWLLYEDVGLNEITRRMRALQVPTSSGTGIWQGSTIHGILTNPTIAGVTYAFTYAYEASKGAKNGRGKLVRRPREEWVEIPGATPAIISKAEFDAIQQKLAQNRSNPRRQTILFYWLQGHVICGLCGRRYRVKSTLVNSKSNPHYVCYYECPCGNRMISPNRCTNRRWNRDRLQDLVWEQLRAFLLKPEAVLAGVEALRDNASQEYYYRQELSDIDRALKRLDEEQWGLLQQAKRGFPEAMVEADNKRINESRASLLQRKADLDEKIAQAAKAADNMAGIEKFCQLARRNIDTLTDEDKRLAAQALDMKVRIYPDRINIEGIIPILDTIPSDYLTSRCLGLERVKAEQPAR